MCALACSPFVTPWTVVRQATLSMGFPVSFSRGSCQPREEELGRVLWIKRKGEHQTFRCLVFLLAQFSLVQLLLCLTLCDPMDCSTPGLPVHHQLRSLLKLMAIESVMPSNHLILCHPLLLLPSSFPSIRAFSNESVLHIRWPKYFTLIDNPHIGFSLRLCLALEPELSMRNCCHLVATSSRTTLKPVLKEFYYSKGLCVQLFVTPWTVAHQALLSMGFPRQEYWSGLPFPSPW